MNVYVAADVSAVSSIAVLCGSKRRRFIPAECCLLLRVQCTAPRAACGRTFLALTSRHTDDVRRSDLVFAAHVI